MKKSLLTIALLASCAASFAQKANITKAETAINAALMDPKNIKYDKVAEAQALLEAAMTDPVSSTMYKTYEDMARVHQINGAKIFGVAQAGGELDSLAFFNAQVGILDCYVKAWDLINTPNEKGKLQIVKPEDRDKQKALYLPTAVGVRGQLLPFASATYKTHPKECIQYLEKYYQAFDSKLLEGTSTAKDDTLKVYSYYIYAQALKNMGAPAAEYKKWMEKSFDSENGAAACYELMKAAKEEGNIAEFEKYARIGIQKWPSESTFSENITFYYFQEKKWDDFMNFANGILKDDPNNSRMLRMVAQAYYEQNKSKETLETLKKVEALDPNDPDIIEFIGNLSFTMAQKNATNKTVSKQYYQESIKYYLRLKDLAPEESKKWGYALYACYNNIGDTANAAKYKKYAQ